MELQLDDFSFMRFQVGLALPGGGMAILILIQGVAILFTETRNRLAFGINDFDENSALLGIGVDQKLLPAENKWPGNKSPFARAGVHGDKAVKSQLGQPDPALPLRDA